MLAGLMPLFLVLLPILAIVLLILARRRIEFGIKSQPEENGEPHACAPGSFSPMTVVRTRKFDLGTGPQELLVFHGLYCSECNRELCCEACGKTPAFGAMLVSHEEGAHWAHCCEPSRWAVRYGGKTLAEDDRSFMAANVDENPLRWN